MNSAEFLAVAGSVWLLSLFKEVKTSEQWTIAVCVSEVNCKHTWVPSSTSMIRLIK